jgi:hypothetical protein
VDTIKKIIPLDLDPRQLIPTINCVRLARIFEPVAGRVEAFGVPRRSPLKALCYSGLRMTAISWSRSHVDLLLQLLKWLSTNVSSRETRNGTHA